MEELRANVVQSPRVHMMLLVVLVLLMCPCADSTASADGFASSEYHRAPCFSLRPVDKSSDSQRHAVCIGAGK